MSNITPFSVIYTLRFLQCALYLSQLLLFVKMHFLTERTSFELSFLTVHIVSTKADYSTLCKKAIYA